MSRRQTLGALVVAAVFATAAVGIAARRDSTETAAPEIVTATVQQRDLRAVITATGALTRSGERTIGYLTSSTSEAPTNARLAADIQVDLDRETAVAAGTLTPLAMTAQRDRDTTTSTTTTSSATTSTTSSSTTTSTTEPRPPAPPERRQEERPAERPERREEERPAEELNGDLATDGAEGAAQEAPPAVVTALAPESNRLERGTVLYAVNDAPNIVLIGDRPAWRALEEGTSPGPDIRQLEENLVALGYGTGITVDEKFTPATAAAVGAWERDLGRAEPDSRVEVGEVTFIPKEARVLRHEAALGNTVRPGAPLLTVAALTQTVEVPVVPKDLPSWEAGSAVELTYADGTRSTGVISVIGRDATAPEAEAEPTVTVIVPPTAPPTTEQPDNSPVEVFVPVAERIGVLAVPVAALVDGPNGGIGVQIPSREATRVVPIEVGLDADGFVEVMNGLAEGDEVVVPG